MKKTWSYAQRKNLKKVNRGCAKKQYNTEDDVIFVGREQMFSHGSDQLYYYQCDVCEKWHLTSKSTENKIK
jgi:hypothetical protein